MQDEHQSATTNNGETIQANTSAAESIASIESAGYGAYANIGPDGNPMADKPKAPAQSSPQAPENTEEEVVEENNESEEAPKESIFTQPAKKPGPQRDFTGLPAEMHNLFKRMSNEAFNAIKPQIIESLKLKEEHENLKKQLESVTGQHFFELPDAYTITPEYKQVAQHVQQLTAEEAFWRQQAVNIEGGNKVKLLHRNPATGEVYATEEMDASPEIATTIREQLFTARQLRTQTQQQLDGLAGTFKQKHTDYTNGIKSLEDSVYKGVNKEALKPVVDSVLQMFPPHMRNRADTKVFAAIGAINQELVKELARQKSTQNGKKIQQRTAASGVPTVEATGAAVSKKPKTSDVLAEMENFKANGYVL